MRTPDFWYQRSVTLKATLLRPVAALYGRIVQKKARQKYRYRSHLGVICVGNVVMGGSGKTPVVQSLVQMLQTMGHRPAILLRGYGGILKGPVRVDPARHTVLHVGDEALLHAAIAPTYVAADRVKGAKLIEDDPDITHIVMDDGLQNPALYKNLSVIVVNGSNPFGNRQLFPAGPLREKMNDALQRANGVVVLGDDAHALDKAYEPAFYLQADRLSAPAPHLEGQHLYAFAGIGRPEIFFQDIQNIQGVTVVATHAFPDHHSFTPDQLTALAQRADAQKARLVTTRKDWVRLPPEWRDRVAVLDMMLAWRQPESVIAMLATV